MRERPPDLPDFDSPPINEVAVGVVFDPIQGFAQGHAGLLWAALRSELPRTQDVPRVDPIVESVSTPFTPTFPFQVRLGNALPRAWFIGQDESFLVQLQNDTFIQNWRKRSSTYPRFEALADEFHRNYGVFTSLLHENQLPPAKLRQVEVTYVNWIPQVTLRELLVGVPGISDLLPGNLSPDSAQWAQRNTIMVNDRAIGILGIEVVPGALGGKTATQGYRFSLTARFPWGLADSSLEDLMFVGRDMIVRTFAAITTTDMHTRWGRNK